MRVLSIAFIFALAVTLVAAADVSGKWVAPMQGRDGQTRDITFNLTVNGNQLSGTVTTPRGDSEISDGKVDGNQISFTQVVNFGGNEAKVLYKGTVSEDGNSIEFTRTFERGQGGGGQGGEGGGRGAGRARTFTAKRASS